MNNLIEERDERTRRRKKYKKKVDSMFNLSYKDDETMRLSANIKTLSETRIRLLDEGAIVGDDYIDFIIKKGTLEKFLAGENEYIPNLDDDFTGTVNLGHMDFATFPFIIGEWRKEDLSLVDIDDDGRKGIDVEVHLDADSMFVRELQRQPYDIGISSEFYYHVDWDTTDDVGYMVIDEVYIFAYGLVGECGNVNSSGLKLSKGEEDMLKEQLEELKAKQDEPIPEEVEELSAEEQGEEAPEEEETETEAAEEEEASEGEEAEGEEGEEAEEAEGEEATYEDVEAYVNTLQEEVCSLRAENAELKKTNKRLNKKLKNELASKSDFVSRFRSLAESTGVVEEAAPEEEKVSDYIFGDGIGE